MSENLKDILSNLSPEIDQETLLLYLQNKLSEQQRYDVEKKLLENEFASEAAEGLQQFKSQEKLNLIAEQLNQGLKSKLQRKKRREKIHLTEQPWLYLAIIIIIMLIILSYFVIHTLVNKHP